METIFFLQECQMITFLHFLTKEQYDLIKTFDLVDDYHLKINITVRTGLYLVDDRTLQLTLCVTGHRWQRIL